MNTVLITGGCGFIGSNFINYLLKYHDDFRIINLDALTYAGNKNNLAHFEHESRYHFIHGDICDEQTVNSIFSTYNIDQVIHFAAETHVDRSIMDPLQFLRTNVLGTGVLLEAARRSWGNKFSGHRFHHISTDEVFGSLSSKDPAFNEATPYSPNSPYSASKAASDHLVRAYFTTYGLPVTISNCSNNYGPFQFPEKLIPLMISNAIQGKSLPIYGDGAQIRDWLYVEDHCSAIDLILQLGKNGETYCIGGNNQPTNIEIVTQITSILDELLPKSPYRPHAQLIQHVTDRPGHDRRYDINISKIHNELGWSPHENLHSGLKKTVIWYLEHLAWMNEVNQNQDFSEFLKANYTSR
jgi:dTDP-glucose 4,6-dehydratase